MNSPSAMKACKALVHKVGTLNVEESREYVSDQIAKIRVSTEGQDGLSSFLGKKTPPWVYQQS